MTNLQAEIAAQYKNIPTAMSFSKEDAGAFLKQQRVKENQKEEKFQRRCRGLVAVAKSQREPAERKDVGVALEVENLRKVLIQVFFQKMGDGNGGTRILERLRRQFR
jgi:hypothetical protein